MYIHGKKHISYIYIYTQIWNYMDIWHGIDMDDMIWTLIQWMLILATAARCWPWPLASVQLVSSPVGLQLIHVRPGRPLCETGSCMSCMVISWETWIMDVKDGWMCACYNFHGIVNGWSSCTWFVWWLLQPAICVFFVWLYFIMEIFSRVNAWLRQISGLELVLRYDSCIYPQYLYLVSTMYWKIESISSIYL